MKKVRLVQLVVQPVLVVDDGDDLVPLQVDPIPVPAASWPIFSAETWPALLDRLTEQVNSQEDTEDG